MHSPLPERVVGAVLIGGKSTRMGRPKALLTLDGQTFLQRACLALRPLCGEVLLVGSPGDTAEPALRSEPLERLADAENVRGPAAGLLACLRARPGRTILLATCDQPLMTSAALRWLLHERRPRCVAVLARRAPNSTPEGRSSDEGLEPLPGVFEPCALAVIEALAASGDHSLRQLAQRRDVFAPALPPEFMCCWTNVNTPEDFVRVGEV